MAPPDLFPGPGIVVTSRGSAASKAAPSRLTRFRIIEAGHPLPDPDGVEGARAIASSLAGCTERDLVLVLISGGGSALLPSPAPGLDLSDEIEATRLLLSAGADIGELNTVRKHISLLKGGGLAKAASPAVVRGLILSDVIGDDPAVIASGPLSPDPTTFADALDVVRRKGVFDRIPPAVRRRLLRGVRGEIPETPKPGDPVLASVRATIVGGNRASVDAAREKARSLGYSIGAAPWPVTGEARAAAEMLAALVRPAAASLGGPTAFVTGGETTVTVRGRGRGGRNQEMALALALAMESHAGDPWVFLSAGTDGVDGPTPAAGGLVDGSTVARLRSAGADPRRLLEANDSHAALSASGDLVMTGPTGTNVADLQILMIRPPGVAPARGEGRR
jgi:hydroxypyruvate reductase